MSSWNNICFVQAGLESALFQWLRTLCGRPQAMCFLADIYVSKKISLPFSLSSSLTFTLANDPVFLDAALQYPEGIFMAAEALRYVPEFLAPYIPLWQDINRILTSHRTVVSWITNSNRASNVLNDYLTPVIEESLRLRALCDPSINKPVRDPLIHAVYLLVETKKGRLIVSNGL